MEVCGKRAYALLEKLNFVKLGGTPEELKAAKLFQQELASFGVEGRIEEFQVNRAQVSKVSLEVTEPFKKEYVVTGYGISGNTLEEGLVAPLIYGEDGEELSLYDAKGKIVLLNKAVNVKMYHRLVKAGAVGFICASGEPMDDLENTDLEVKALRRERHLKDKDGGEVAQIPGVTIRAIDAMNIIRSEATTVRLNLQQEEYKATSQNVIADIQGSDGSNDTIVFTAHYDSVPFSPGIYDNAAGSVIIMELCRYFKEHQPKRNLRFIWCGSEEMGLLGSLDYVKRHEEELKDILFVINVDLAGQVLGTHFAKITAEEGLVQMITYLSKEVGLYLDIKQEVYSSDSTSFADKGIPAVSFGKSGKGIHCRNDKIDWTSAASLDQTANFVKLFTERVVNAKVFPVPREMPKKMVESINEYFGRDKEGIKAPKEEKETKVAKEAQA